MPRTKLLEILFVVTAGLGLLFVGWAVLIDRTAAPAPTLTTTATTAAPITAAPTPTPTIPPSPTPASPITLTILHTNDTWGYVWPCG
ncbi:MAG: hypothetical protein J7M16_03975 [Anaerolineae bacterium]|nr:hypothetical protein [Anaerolineae bacterium]